jgi:predicted RNase H-like HicB family nuclease
VYQITLEINRLDEGPYLGTSPDLPGLIVQRATPEEVVAIAPDVARDLIAVMVETGQTPPGSLQLDMPAHVQIVVSV